MKDRNRIALQIGLMLSLMHIVYFITIYFLDGVGAIDPTNKYDFWIPAIFIFIGLKFYRDKLNGGSLRFWEGLHLGGLTAIITCFTVFLFMLLFFHVIDQTYLKESIDLALEEMYALRANGMEAEGWTLEQFNNEMPAHQPIIDSLPKTTATDLASSKMMVLGLAGFGYTLLISAFLRK